MDTDLSTSPSRCWIKLTGPSGSGKSTLCKKIAFQINDVRDFFTDQEREIIIKNKSIIDALLSDIICRKCAYVGPRMDPSKFFLLPNEYRQIFSNVDMPDDISTVASQGEKQRFVLLEAISTGADFLILDECLSGIPEHHEWEILSTIKFQMPQVSCLYVSHRNNKDIDILFDKEIGL